MRVEFSNHMNSRTYGKTVWQILWPPIRGRSPCSMPPSSRLIPHSSQALREAGTISNEQPLSGAECATATVAKWPMAVLAPKPPLRKVSLALWSLRTAGKADWRVCSGAASTRGGVS